MPVKSRINGEYIREIAYYPLRLPLNQLNDRAGLSDNYIYQLVDEAAAVNVSIATLDALHNAIEARMLELGLQPPDDLWQRLTVQEIVPPAGDGRNA